MTSIVRLSTVNSIPINLNNFLAPVKSSTTGPSKESTTNELFVKNDALIIQSDCFANTSYVDKLYPAPTLVTNRTATVLVSANVAQAIQAYLLNSTQYKLINNTQITPEGLAGYALGANNHSFTPSWNVTYYVFLRNCGNETINCDVNVNTTYTIQTFDYSLTSFGLLLLVGSILFFTTSFAFGNPLYAASYKAYTKTFFKGTSDYSVEQENTPKWAWITLGCMLLFSIGIVFSLLVYLPFGIPNALLPLVIDTSIRVGVFFFLACLIVFAIEILFMGLAYNLINGCILWHFGVKKGRVRNIDLANRFVKTWKKMITRLKAIAIYCAISLIVICAWFALSQIMPLQFTSLLYYLIIALIPITIFLSYTLLACYRMIYSNESDFKQERFFIYSGITASMAVGFLFVGGWVLSWNLMLNTVYSTVVSSGYLAAGMPEVGGALSALFSQIPIMIEMMKQNLIFVIEGVLMFIFATTLSLNYVLSPTKNPKKKLRSIRSEILIFLLVFAFIYVISGGEISCSILGSLGLAIGKSFVGIMMREITIPSKNGQCINCKKDLPPLDSAFCPYCGTKIEDENKQ